MAIKEYGEFNNIFAVDAFLKERSRLYGKSKRDAGLYDEWLHRQLKLLDEYGIENSILIKKKVFEKIISNHTLYSIRKLGFPGNPRSLFTVIVDGDYEMYVLLTAFKEENISDYNNAIERAVGRIAEEYSIIRKAEV